MPGDDQLVAPGLLDFELTNIAWKKIRRYPDEEDALTNGLTDALALNVTRVPVDHRAVVQLSLRTGLSTYDTSYLYLARRFGAPLVTLDDRLRRAAGE